jgi:hypothetical protein
MRVTSMGRPVDILELDAKRQMGVESSPELMPGTQSPIEAGKALLIEEIW